MPSSAPKVRISLACVACKRRKAKCSGGPPPCQSCKVAKTECIIDESLDGRRKASAKRTYDELSYHKSFLESLFTYIRTFDQPAVEQLAHLAKSNVPWTEIGAVIEESLRLARQNADADTETDGLPSDLKIDVSISRLIQQKIEGYASESETASSTPVLQRLSVDDQYQQPSDEERVLSFLKKTSFHELSSIIGYVQRTEIRTLYDGLFEYVAKLDRREGGDVSMAKITTPRSSNFEFSRARSLSLTNLFEYQQYLQGLFSEYDSSELRASPVTSSKSREEWHPALRLRFSSSSADSDESNAGLAPAQEPTTDGVDSERTSQKSRAAGTTLQDMVLMRPVQGDHKASPTNQLRLTLRTDPNGLLFEAKPGNPSPSMKCLASQSVTDAITTRERTSWEQKFANLSLPLYQVLPLTGIDDSPLARSYTSYRDEARAMLLRGVPLYELFGLDKIEVNLLFRPRKSSDVHSVCNWASELCGAFRRDFDMPWIMAWTMLLSRFMRWLLIPTEESYNEIPPIMRPTQAQRFIPHNPAADLIAIPALRDALCMRFRDWISPMINNCRFSWSGSLEDAVKHDPALDTYVLTEEFQKAVHNTENFVISKRVVEAFPELEGRTDVKVEDG